MVLGLATNDSPSRMRPSMHGGCARCMVVSAVAHATPARLSGAVSYSSTPSTTVHGLMDGHADIVFQVNINDEHSARPTLVASLKLECLS